MGDNEKPAKVATEKSIEELKSMLNSDDPEVAGEGIRRARTLVNLRPESRLEELLEPLASAVWTHESFQGYLEETLADIAKDRPAYISTNALQKLSESEHWYSRWLVLWILNNMSYRHPGLVPTELLEKLTKDEKWWNKEFAESILNRVWRSKIG